MIFEIIDAPDAMIGESALPNLTLPAQLQA
jgi:hypothetical protein